MKINDIHYAFDGYHNRYYQWYYGYYSYYWNFIGILNNHFAPSIRELKSFISKFSNKQEHEFTKDDECELLNILVGYDLVAYQDFRELVYKTKFHKNNKFSCNTLINVIKSLINAGILTADNIYTCGKQCKHESLGFIPSLALDKLNQAGILTQEIFDIVMASKDPAYIACIITSLHKTRLLTQENKDVLKNFDGNSCSLSKIVQVIELLERGNLLTQENFNLVITYHAVFTEIVMTSIYLIDENHLNQQVFDHIFELCNRSKENIKAAIKTIEEYCRTLHREFCLEHLNNNPVLNNLPILNQSQSTHTASVHRSVSTSAEKLMKSYGDQINSPKEVIEEIARWLNSLARPDFKTHATNQLIQLFIQLEQPFLDSNIQISNRQIAVLIWQTIVEIVKCPTVFENIKVEAAHRAVTRLKQAQHVYVDPVSKVNTHQLLALIWRAIHDDKKRQGSLEDARIRLIDGLYDLQRGGNLNEKNVDRGGRDKFICSRGAVNKLLESIAGTHPDVEIIFITKGSAALKLPIIVKEEIEKYLSQLARSSSTATALGEVMRLTRRLKKEGPEVLWGIIEPRIKERISDEFYSIFSENLADFNAFIDCGKEVSLENLSNFQKKMSDSISYQTLCSGSQSFTLYNLSPQQQTAIRSDHPVDNKRMGRY